MADLKALAQKLVVDGPHKVEGTPRRVRGLLGGEYVFDTTMAVYVWEHAYYPYFYIPKSEFRGDVLKIHGEEEKGFWFGELASGGKSTERVVGFESGELAGLVKIEVEALDAWFAEDEKLLASHPKDPYKRVDCIPSSREVRIEVEGEVIARSSQNVFLFETMLRPRYYLGVTGLEWGALKESETVSYCPYKGMSNYYDIVVNGKVIKDAVWYYKYPTPEAALVAGRFCFYNEKVDVFVDGVKEEEVGYKR